AVGHDAGDGMAVLGDIDVSAVLGSGGFERPAEDRAVELLGAGGVGCGQIDPAWRAQRGAVTDRHGDLLVVSWPREKGGSPLSTDAGPETHRRRRSAMSPTVSVRAG